MIKSTTLTLISLFLIPLMANATPNNVSINALSNINSHKVYLSLSKAESPSPLIRQLDLANGKISPLSTSKEFIGKEILALYSFKKSLFAVIQRTSREGEAALIMVYKTQTKSWRHVKTMNCISFDTILFAKNKISFECEEINSGKEGGYKTIIRSASTTEPLGNIKMILPLKKVRNSSFYVEVHGIPSMWKSVEFKDLANKKNKNSKSYSAIQLAK